MIPNSYVDTSGNIVSYNGWSRTDCIPVNLYRKMTVKSSRSSSYNWFYDEEKNPIVRFSVSTTYQDISIPKTAYYVIFSNQFGSTETTEGKLTLKSEIETTRNLCDGYFVRGSINAQTGADETSSSSKRSLYFNEIEESSKYYFKGTGGTGKAYFYDENQDFISATSSWRSSYIFTAPTGAKYFKLVFGNDTSDIVLSKLTYYPNYVDIYTSVDNTARDNISFLYKNTSPVSIKVCTFNVGRWYNGQTRVPEDKVAEQKSKWFTFMGKENIDLLCMQEAEEYFDQNQTLQPYPLFLHTSYLSFNHDNNSSWDVIAPKREFSYIGYVARGLNTGSENGIIYCGGKAIYVMNLHLSTETGSEGRRVADMQRVAEWLSDQEYAIVFGDFNAYSTEEFNIFSNYNMANCRDFGNIATWPHTSDSWPNPCIDNIITTKNIEISYAYAFEDFDLSDHRPLIARLLIR